MSDKNVVVAGKTIKAPECDKLLAVKDKSQAIGEFLDWLQNERKVTLAEYGDERDTRETLLPVHKSIEDWCAEFFEIDLAKVERERRAILDAIRKAQS